jgi:glutamate 5-kinase
MRPESHKATAHLLLQAARRAVIKLGTSIVTNAAGEFNIECVERIVCEIAELRRAGRQVVLVSSGAIGLGRGRLGLLRESRNDMATRQACAAIGQSLLMNAYEQLFRVHDIKIAQVLLTVDDFADWNRYQNLRRTMERLLKLNVLPIVNENDTVSIAEITNIKNSQRVFGDNDRLAALVMSKLGADALVLLTDVDGLLSVPPATNKGDESAVVHLVTEITSELRAVASGPSQRGRGGMITKLEAAQIAMRTGVAVVANGTRPETLSRIFKGEAVGTRFESSSHWRGKKRWIAFATTARGQLVVNDGAREAVLRDKASLLATGVVEVVNDFAAHDVVGVFDMHGQEFARGIVNFDRSETLRLIHSRDQKRRRAKDRVLITRDNLVVNQKSVV